MSHALVQPTRDQRDSPPGHQLAKRPGDRTFREKLRLVFRVPVYAVFALTCALALGTLHGDRRLLFRITREDGPIEWMTVAALLTLAVVVVRHLWSLPKEALPAWVRAAFFALIGLAFFAAGEEISWGQRIFGFSTGETMHNLNLQHETNLHNLIPGALFNGIIVFSLGIGFVLIPTIWRRRSADPPAWLPSPEVSLLMLDTILINHYRFSSLPEQIGIVVIVALLVFATFDALRSGPATMTLAAVAGWVTFGCLYYSKAILRVHNHQYEIRELLIVMLAGVWADQTLKAYAEKNAKPV